MLEKREAVKKRQVVIYKMQDELNTKIAVLDEEKSHLANLRLKV
jgi:hypothetical protein